MNEGRYHGNNPKQIVSTRNMHLFVPDDIVDIPISDYSRNNDFRTNNTIYCWSCNSVGFVDIASK